MLNLSGGTATLVKSRLFDRVIIMLSCLCLWMIIESGFSIYIKTAGAISLLIYLGYLLRCQTVALSIEKLEWCSGQYFLHGPIGRDGPFDKMKVILDAGIFFLLHLSSSERQRVIVIFFDQIDPNDYRTLRIVEKIT